MPPLGMVFDIRAKRCGGVADKNEREILDVALKRFKESQEGSDYNRKAYSEDIRFARLGEQWEDSIKKQREEESRPCLTVNKLPTFIRQVVNEARQNRPGINVAPSDDQTDIDKATVVEGLIRHIERRSPADEVYGTAIDNAVSGGFGFFRVVVDYPDEMSFDLQIKLVPVSNSLSVHWDVNTDRYDAKDWDYCFVSEMLTEEEFKQRYPDAEPVNFEGAERSDLTEHWLEDDKTRVAEYWSREIEKRTIVQLSDGTITDSEQLENGVSDVLAAGGIEVIQSREIEIPKVIRRVISGAEILEEEDWPGKHIPIAPVWGDRVVIDGRTHYRSMVVDAKGPQQMLNFWRSQTAELVALAPRSPWLVHETAIPRGYEGVKWQTANTRSHQFLTYSGGVPPQRLPFASIPTGATQESLSASDDMKAVMGVFDAALGARSNETSGRAILARQREADTSNFHFLDNLNRAIRYAGEVMAEIIPAVYSQQTSVRILGDDMTESIVELGQSEGAFDLSIGRYDVTVEAGPSYQSQRQEAREVLAEIMQMVPGAAQLIGDKFMESLDFKGAKEISERLKLFLPPEVRAAEGLGPQPQMEPPMAGAQMPGPPVGGGPQSPQPTLDQAGPVGAVPPPF